MRMKSAGRRKRMSDVKTIRDFLKLVGNILEFGYKVISIDEIENDIFRLRFEIPQKHSIVRDDLYLYIDLVTGYVVRLVRGHYTFGKYEITDGWDQERYDSLRKAEKRVVELVKKIREEVKRWESDR